MGAFLGISLWIALVTVIPGLITISLIYFAYIIADPSLLTNEGGHLFAIKNDWILAGIALTIMILTQALGILLEELFTRAKLYPWSEKVNSISVYTLFSPCCQSIMMHMDI